MWSDRRHALQQLVNCEWVSEMERRYYDAFTELFGIIAGLEQEKHALKLQLRDVLEGKVILARAEP